MERLYYITELASEAGATPRAIRFYESKGLLTPRRVGNTRVCTGRDLARLTMVLRGKRLGFSLQRIKELLDLTEIDPERIERLDPVLEAIRRRLEAIEQRRHDIEVFDKELRAIRRRITRARTAKSPAQRNAEGTVT